MDPNGSHLGACMFDIVQAPSSERSTVWQPSNLPAWEPELPADVPGVHANLIDPRVLRTGRLLRMQDQLGYSAPCHRFTLYDLYRYGYKG